MAKLQLLIIILLISLGSAFAADQVNEADYGLFIKASPTVNTQRTSLILENNAPLKLDKKETTLSFDMYIRKEYVFGIVSRIITNKNENIDLMLTVNDDKQHPILVINESAYTVNQDIVTEEWIPVGITLSKEKEAIMLTFGKEVLSIPYDLSETSHAKISFGVCRFEPFGSTDIASVNIKDVKIFNDGELKRYWKLKEHLRDGVLDSISGIPAIAVNPQWIIDINSAWKKIYTDRVLLNTQVTFDEQSKFYMVSPDSKRINVFDTRTGTADTILVAGGCIASNSPNMIFFDSVSNNLVTYNLDESYFSLYSFETNRWSSDRKPKTDPYLNNSAIYQPSKQTLYSFGGYGYHKYDHDLIKMYPANGNQKKTELMEIPPRYSASTVIVDDTLYVFGGRGSKSGRQEILPRNYYDLYSVNLQMDQAIKLWEEEEFEDYFLPGENMVFDRDRNCFYLFTSQHGGTLFKLETKKKGLEQMSFPIGENMESFYLYTNLYFSKSQQKLFSVIYKQVTEQEVVLTIYALDYPPVPIVSLNQIPLPERNKWQENIFLIILWVLGIGLLAYAVFLFRKKKKQAGAENLPVHSKKESPGKSRIGEKNQYDFSKSAVCFLNGFNVIDKNGNNITRQFTPTLQYLLILLILNTAKDGKGIFGKQLIQLLWFDKNEEAAKNNRNVYLSKLRSVFENVGGVETASKNGYWTIQLDDSITCDYIEAMHLFTSIKEDQEKNPTQINKLLELLLRGVLLPNTEIDWLDNFKSDFSNLTIDILTKLSQNEAYQLDDELRLKIADTLFLHDIINEEALYIKCSILFHSGKMGIAQKVYNNFCKEYNHLLGITYKYSLTDVINRISH
ncbi:hypothetical protein FACS189440_02940 [Bacteroidia bacterium]|nr:hypothetical protein FACS189440_02940 [Bacteroidia bacterium]